MPFAMAAAHNPLQTEGSDLPHPTQLPCPPWASSRGAKRVDLRGPGTSLASPPRTAPVISELGRRLHPGGQPGGSCVSPYG